MTPQTPDPLPGRKCWLDGLLLDHGGDEPELRPQHHQHGNPRDVRWAKIATATHGHPDLVGPLFDRLSQSESQQIRQSTAFNLILAYDADPEGTGT